MSVAVAIALGGALGSWLRYAVTKEVEARTNLIDTGTFGVNVVGALGLGLMVGLVESRFPDTPRWHASGLGIGVAGGFTTFSSYTLDGFRHLEDGRAFLALVYLAGSVAAGMAAIAAGIWLGRQGT